MKTMNPKGKILIAVIFLYFQLNAQSTKILHNHIGYETTAPKSGVVLSKETDMVTSFAIIDYTTGIKIMEGNPKYIGTVDKWRDWHFWTFSFDAVAVTGTYIIECQINGGAVRSFPFVIQDNLLERNTLSDVVYYFKGQRSSGLLDKADQEMTFDKGKRDTVDVHGGWYDATGDYGKHISHLTFSTYFNPQQINLTVWSLFETYNALKERNDPNFDQYKRRLLDEAMFGADFLVRMKAPAGSFFRTISGKGPEKKAEDRRITPTMTGFSITKKPSDGIDGEEEKQKGNGEVVSYEISYRAGAGLSIAALAIASTFDVSGDFENSEYLKAAKDAFFYLEKNNVSLTNDGKENIVDDYCALMAATELYNATSDIVYKEAADRRAASLTARLIQNSEGHYFWRADDKERPFFHAADAGLPVVSLLKYVEIAEEGDRKRILEVVKRSMKAEIDLTNEVNNPFGYARQYVQNKEGIKRNSFFYPHDAETAPWWQGENARLGSLATAARMASNYFKEDTKFYRDLQSYAWNQLNWILGLNPFDACMLEGHGRNNVQYLFFNSYEYTNAPGGICNGITGGLYDDHDIDLNRGYNETGKDNDWRWAEQWLPHAAWYLIAISSK
jgi:hypothetical protein